MKGLPRDELLVDVELQCGYLTETRPHTESLSTPAAKSVYALTYHTDAHRFVGDFTLRRLSMPIDFNVFASICDILVTTLRVGKPSAEMFLWKLSSYYIGCDNGGRNVL
jgi:hypothetical protein